LEEIISIDLHMYAAGWECEESEYKIKRMDDTPEDSKA